MIPQDNGSARWESDTAGISAPSSRVLLSRVFRQRGEDSSGDEGEEDDEGEGEQEQEQEQEQEHEQALVHGQTGNADMLGADGGVHSDACPMGLFYYFNSPCTADVCNCSELVDRGFLHLIVVAPVCGQSLRVFFWWRGSAHRGAL